MHCHNPAFLKSAAGGDHASGRGIYEKEGRFCLTCKAIIAPNNLPEIKDKSDGVWGKLVVIPFAAKFVDNPKASNKHKIDLTLERKLVACADTLLAFLVHYYPTYGQKSVRKPQYPKVVQESTQEYRYPFNMAQRFVDTWVVQKSDMKLPMEAMLTKLDEFCELIKNPNTSALHREIYTILKNMSTRGKVQIKIPNSDNTNLRGWEGITLRDEPWTLKDVEETGEEVETQIVQRKPVQKKDNVEMECEPPSQERTAKVIYPTYHVGGDICCVKVEEADVKVIQDIANTYSFGCSSREKSYRQKMRIRTSAFSVVQSSLTMV